MGTLKTRWRNKIFLKEIGNREKGIDKEGFMKYFSDEPITLVNNY